MIVVLAVTCAISGFILGVNYSIKYITPKIILHIIDEQGYTVENGRIVLKEEKKP